MWRFCWNRFSICLLVHFSFGLQFDAFVCCIPFPFLFHSHSIAVPFPFHSRSIPISFLFHSHFIPIPFPLHSHFIPAPFPFHSTLNRFSDLSSFFTGFFRKVQSVCLSLTWRAEEKKHHTSDLKVGLLFRSYFGQPGKSGIFLGLLSQKLRENLCRLRQQVFITLGQLSWKL